MWKNVRLRNLEVFLEGAKSTLHNQEEKIGVWCTSAGVFTVIDVSDKVAEFNCAPVTLHNEYNVKTLIDTAPVAHTNTAKFVFDDE